MASRKRSQIVEQADAEHQRGARQDRQQRPERRSRPTQSDVGQVETDEGQCGGADEGESADAGHRSRMNLPSTWRVYKPDRQGGGANEWREPQGEGCARQAQ